MADASTARRLLRNSRVFNLKAITTSLCGLSTVFCLLYVLRSPGDVGRHRPITAAYTGPPRGMAAAAENALTISLQSSFPIPRKIWQTWKTPAQSLEPDLRAYAKSWTSQNPEYRYELLTDTGMHAFVADKFASTPGVIDVFKTRMHAILRADLARYLILLAEGGVYSDIDTTCIRPIERWIPPEFSGRVGMLLGVEYDALESSVWDGRLPVEFVQWTIMTRPGHPIMKAVVDDVIEGLKNTAIQTWLDVVTTTGPHAWSKSIYRSLSAQEGRNVSHDDFSNMTEPVLMGDVLIMNVNAFGSGQIHSNALPQPNEQELVRHHYHGANNWLAEFKANEQNIPEHHETENEGSVGS